MIVICEKCKASFLVPASLFEAGPRTVRCARCGHTWMEKPEEKPEEKTSEEASATEKVTTDTTETEETPTEKQTPQEKAKEALEEEIAEEIEEIAEELEETESEKPTPPPVKEIDPQEIECKKSFIYHAFQALAFLAWGKIFLWFTLLIILLLSIFIPTAYFGRNHIVDAWPKTEIYYELLGIEVEYAPNPLLLQRIHSERRYMDGAMHLVVSGDIFNQSAITQPIPNIKADAHGPKGVILQSWVIKPSREEISSDQTTPFFSAVLSPEGNVVEVTLSFISSENEHNEQPKP